MTKQTPRTTEERTPRDRAIDLIYDSMERRGFGSPQSRAHAVELVEEVEAAAATLSLPDEWLLSISMMEAARRIDMEIPVGHSWRELAMLTNVILADQYRAASSGPSKGEPTCHVHRHPYGPQYHDECDITDRAASPAGPEAPGIRNRLLASRFDPSVSLDELIGAGPEAVPQSEPPYEGYFDEFGDERQALDTGHSPSCPARQGEPCDDAVCGANGIRMLLEDIIAGKTNLIAASRPPVRTAGDGGPDTDVWTCSCGLTRPVTGSYGCADCGDGRPDSWERVR
jgi:hypothetical protein